MLELPTVTFLSVDVVNPKRTIVVLAESARWCRPASSILLTDIRRHPGIAAFASDHGVRLVDHVESDKTVTLEGIARKFFVDYERSHILEPFNHIGKSSHILWIDADAGVINPSAWNPFWLSYDYIGAPWPPHVYPHYPACDGKTNAVGNSGFSLRSRKFCQVSVMATRLHPNDATSVIGDCWLCRTMRPWMEREHHVDFAPVEVAEKFSCENRIYSGQFGFHGHATIKMNGWSWP